MVQTPHGNGRLELVKFHSPAHEGDHRAAPANAPGIRHIAVAVEEIDAVVGGLRGRGAELVSDPRAPIGARERWGAGESGRLR